MTERMTFRWVAAAAVAMMALSACSDDEESKPVLGTPVPTSDGGVTVPGDMGPLAGDMDASDGALPDGGVDDGGVDDAGADAGMDAGADMMPDACVPRSIEQACAAASRACGAFSAAPSDGCGGTLDATMCGVCARPQICEESEDGSGAILSSVCGCSEQEPEVICQAEGKLCGELDPPCSQVVCDNFCVSSITAGDRYNCAIGSGRARCWGNNDKGQLGLGNTTSVRNPASVASPLLIEQIAAGEGHTCAILQDTSLVCWGANGTGQLGVGTTVDATSINLSDPNSRAFAQGVAHVVAGDEHTCALVDTDYVHDPASTARPAPPFSAYCWGSNVEGRVGHGALLLNTSAATPRLVDGLEDNVYQLEAGQRHTCAILDAHDAIDPSARHIACWGWAAAGQTGNLPVSTSTLNQKAINDTPMGTTPPAPIPYRYVNVGPPSTTVPIAFPTPVYVRTTDIMSTENYKGQFVELALGATFSCARDAQEQMMCWGVMPFDHVRGTCLDPFTAQEVSECAAWPDIASSTTYPIINQRASNGGFVFSTTNGITYPEGTTLYSNAAVRPTPVVHDRNDPLLLPTGADKGDRPTTSHIQGHHKHLCMLVEETTMNKTNIYCVGNNERGKLGDGSNSPRGTLAPIKGDVDGNIVRGVALSLGEQHTCAIASNENIKCWGSNAAGQIGNENLKQDESFRPFDVLLR